jgi:hypothetical protein
MKAVDKIAIIDLLQQRETELMKLWDCETRIGLLLGKAYPFPAPPALPSRRKRLPAKSKAAQSTTLRRLKKNQENAYRVHYRLEGQPESTLQVEVELCRELLKLQVPGFSITRIETVKLDASMSCQVLDVLYKRSGKQKKV